MHHLAQVGPVRGACTRVESSGRWAENRWGRIDDGAQREIDRGRDDSADEGADAWHAQ